MAAADTARLVAELSLDDKKFTRGMASANKSIGTLEATAKRAGQGISTLGRNIGLIGIAAAGGIAVAVKGGLESLAELESAISSVDGAIAQMGQTGQISGKQIADWANEIEADIGAAFDDKEITAAAATLIRFGKVTPKNLRKTLEVMTDLAVKTGDVESASSLLAKVLADPAKAAGKLTRVGIILTKAQQDQIKAMTEAGDVAGAQAVLLDELAKSTAGAAAASQGPAARSMAVLKDVIEDVQKALAIGFLPVLTKTADLLSRELAKPETLANIQKFGEGLASGLDDLIEIAKSLPWQTIGDSLKIAGAGAQAVLKAFVELPPWVQTAVLTGWGLNKLTGGALSGIVGELAKGVIKGVLGINAGVVNINAAKVVGGGGGPGIPVAGAAAGLGAVAATTAAAGAAVVGGAQGLANQVTQGVLKSVTGANSELASAVADLGSALSPLPVFSVLTNIQRFMEGDERSLLQRITDGTKESGRNVISGIVPHVQSGTQQAVRSNERLESIRMQNAAANANRITESQSERTAIANAAQDQTAAQARTTEAARSAAAAIRDKDLSVSVNVSNKVSIADLGRTVQQYTRLHHVAS